MGLRNSKKSVDIATSSGSPKKNGTEPTDVKVKDLVEDGQSPRAQTELIEEVADKEASSKLEGHSNGDSPKKEESPENEVAEADKENTKPQENGREETKPSERDDKEDKKEKKVKKKKSFRSFSFLRREKKAAKSQENANGEVTKDEAKTEEAKQDEAASAVAEALASEHTEAEAASAETGKDAVSTAESSSPASPVKSDQEVDATPALVAEAPEVPSVPTPDELAEKVSSAAPETSLEAVTDAVSDSKPEDVEEEAVPEPETKSDAQPAEAGKE